MEIKIIPGMTVRISAMQDLSNAGYPIMPTDHYPVPGVLLTIEVPTEHFDALPDKIREAAKKMAYARITEMDDPEA